MKKSGRPNEANSGLNGHRGRAIPVAVLLIFVVILSAGSGIYAGASFFAQQAPNVTVTTTIYTTTTSWTTSTIWSTVTEVVSGILTTVEYTTSTSTVTVTAGDSYTKLLLHMDGTSGSKTFLDSSFQPHSIIASGNAQIDTSQSEFGGASGRFDGTNSYLSTPNSADFNFGTGDWTVDFWIRPTTLGTNNGIIGTGTTAESGPWLIRITSNGKVGLSRTNVADDLISSSALSANTWTHVAVVRSGNTITMYFNGVSVGTRQATGISYNGGAGSLVIGKTYNNINAYYLNGWLDELRISKGIARWTSNFTPPTAPY